MMPKSQFNTGMPLFFKLWFAFVAVCVLLVWGAGIYLVHSAIEAGPEGLGRVIGSVLRGINESK